MTDNQVNINNDANINGNRNNPNNGNNEINRNHQNNRPMVNVVVGEGELSIVFPAGHHRFTARFHSQERAAAYVTRHSDFVDKLQRIINLTGDNADAEDLDNIDTTVLRDRVRDTEDSFTRWSNDFGDDYIPAFIKTCMEHLRVFCKT
jgi:hypothetical protein